MKLFDKIILGAFLTALFVIAISDTNYKTWFLCLVPAILYYGCACWVTQFNRIYALIYTLTCIVVLPAVMVELLLQQTAVDKELLINIAYYTWWTQYVITGVLLVGTGRLFMIIWRPQLTNILEKQTPSSSS